MENKKVLKRQPGLGKLNRSIKATQVKIAANGHSANRFKRYYENGTAVYKCATCGDTATISLSESGALTDGLAINRACPSKPESQG